MGLSWLDIVIIIVFVLYGLEGIQVGFAASLVDLLSFILSFALGIAFYSKIAIILEQNFSVSSGIANAIGFFLIASITEIFASVVFKKVFQAIHDRSKIKTTSFEKANKILGILPSFASAFILLAFLLSLVASLPLSPFLKRSISSSKMGNIILSQAQGFESSLNLVFGGAIRDTLNFLTIEPQSNEKVTLNFKTTDVSLDKNSEERMLEMINKERVSRGLSPLSADVPLQEVARDFAKDMLRRGYFSHYTLEGLSPFDRMGMVDIFFTSAGENLALSPNVDLAMQGFMRSPGHRENILSPDFQKAGIGVIDVGVYGEMFVQEFTN